MVKFVLEKLSAKDGCRGLPAAVLILYQPHSYRRKNKKFQRLLLLCKTIFALLSEWYDICKKIKYSKDCKTAGRKLAEQLT